MANIDSSLKNWSTTASSNQPDAADAATIQADLQQLQATVRQDLASKGADISSAGTTDLGAVAGLMHDITGTTTITGLGTVSSGIWKIIKFEGTLTLTHNATSLILPGGANITTADGDIGVFISEGSGNWRCVSYSPATGRPVINTLLDSQFRLADNGDSTKLLAFEVSGITTGTTRTITVPDSSGTLPLLGFAQTFSALQTFSAGITLSGTASNINTGSNYISGDGTDTGLSFSGAAATFSSTVATGALTVTGTSTVSGLGTFGTSSTTNQFYSGTSLQAKSINGTSTDSVVGLWHQATSGNNVFIAFATESSPTVQSTIYYDRTNDGLGISSPLTVTGALNTTGKVALGTSTVETLYGLRVNAGNGTQLVLDNAGEQYTQITFNNNGVPGGDIWWDQTNSRTVVNAKTGGSVAHAIAGNIVTSTDAAGLSVTGTLTLNGTAATTFSAFNVAGSTTAASYGTVANTSGQLRFGVESSAGGVLMTGSSAYASILTTVGSTNLQLGVNTTKIVDISSVGISLGTYAGRSTTNPTNALNLFDGTAPVGTMTNGVSLYSASGELRVMDAAGNSTLLSPHDDDGLWVYDSVSPITGKHLRIDMERMIKAINDKFGWNFVHEFALENQ
jgi:hypothetical protein